MQKVQKTYTPEFKREVARLAPHHIGAFGHSQGGATAPFDKIVRCGHVTKVQGCDRIVV